MTGELEQIKQALVGKKDKDGEEIKVAFIMVNKRVKTKLVLENNGRITNPPPGTVLDHSLTGKGSYDFYLVSQHCRVGVPTPSHYTVRRYKSRSEGDHGDDIQVDLHLLQFLGEREDPSASQICRQNGDADGRPQDSATSCGIQEQTWPLLHLISFYLPLNLRV